MTELAGFREQGRSDAESGLVSNEEPGLNRLFVGELARSRSKHPREAQKVEECKHHIFEQLGAQDASQTVLSPSRAADRLRNGRPNRRPV